MPGHYGLASSKVVGRPAEVHGKWPHVISDSAHTHTHTHVLVSGACVQLLGAMTVHKLGQSASVLMVPEQYRKLKNCCC